jgi:hypothetical protein
VNALDLHSERYQPTGSVASEGVQNQLGRPDLDPLAVLVRETVQNSWDARLADDETVLFSLAGWQLTSAQRRTLQELVFARLAPKLGLGALLAGDDPINVLAMSDRGTTGLGGPTRADQAPRPGEATDFVDFLRNVGTPPDKRLGGGTYGFGKVSLYLTSAVRTICVHTHCASADGVDARFMAAALGPHYTDDRVRYTGRHWWGRLARDGIADPLTGREADALAAKIGLPGFERGQTGTTILQLAPAFGERTPEQALRFIALTIVWYFWPKMIPRSGDAVPMNFEVSWNGEGLEIPKPEKYPPLQGFVTAMKELKRTRPRADPNPLTELLSIECQRPIQTLGKLSLCRFPFKPRAPADTGDDEPPEAILGPAHHVALMRNAELVVKYLPGPPLPYDQLEYAGVFLPDEEVDGAFAKAEPPTHDEWTPKMVEDRHEKTFVKVALRRIDEALEAFALPSDRVGETGDQPPLGAFSSVLGNLLPGVDGTGAGRQPSRPAAPPRRGTGNRPAQPRITIGQAGSLCVIDEVRAVRTTFGIRHAEGSAGTVVVAVPTVSVLEGSAVETDPPEGAEIPRVLAWFGPHGRPLRTGDRVRIGLNDGDQWEVAVSVPVDTVVRLELTGEAIAS